MAIVGAWRSEETRQDVSELQRWATHASGVSCRRTEAEPPHDHHSHPAPSLTRCCRRAPAANWRSRLRAEPSRPPYRACSAAATGPTTGATPPAPSPEPPASRARLHLKPVQKGTQQLLAQYGDPLICVRYRYNARRRKRLKTAERVVAERDWDPPRPPFAPDQMVELRVAFAEVAVRQRVKQLVGRGLQTEGSGNCATIAWPSAWATGSSATPHPSLDARHPAKSISMQMPPRYPHRDACIHWWMPPSGRRCRRCSPIIVRR